MVLSPVLPIVASCALSSVTVSAVPSKNIHWSDFITNIVLEMAKATNIEAMVLKVQFR